MADLAGKSAKKKKRKLASQQEEIRPTKAHRINLPENEPAEVELEVEQDQKLEEGRPWKNLKLILSIQNKDVDLQKKVEMVFSFINSRVKGGETEESEKYETVKTSRLVVFLSDWVQSLLISTEKKVKVDGGRNQSGAVEACLDFRCWMIFKFCLEESLNRHVSLNISRNLLRAIGCIARNALSLLNENSSGSIESFSVGEGYELYSVVLDCLSLVFSSEGGLLNENLDLWISTVDPILQLVLKNHSQSSDGGCVDAFFLQLSCLVLEPFAKFLRTHPTRKNGFRDFVDKLLEPLLQLLGILHSNQTRNLLALVEEVLSIGLFHPTHVDGFLGLRGTENYLVFTEGKSTVLKTVVKSYHRHLFDKLEAIMTAKLVSVVSGIGQLFHLFVDRVSKQKGVSVSSGNAKSAGKNGASMQLEKNVSGHVSVDSFGSSSALPDKSYSASSMNAETRKSLFEFFIQIMEPLLFKLNGYVQAKLVQGPALLDAHCILKFINSLLSSFVHEKVYLKTEDISKGACFNFLTKVHDSVMSFAASLPLLSNCDLAHETEMFSFLARELLVAVGYLLDIEYQVIGNDLESLWLMMLSCLAIGLSSVDAPDHCLLTTQILNLGCQLVNLYSELRQVNNVVFALCKAVRFLISCDNNGETSFTRFLSGKNSLPCQAYAKSVEMLLCSQEFKFSIHNAIRSIPEGQGSGCVRQLTADISESLKWMKESCAVADGIKFNNLKARDCGIPGFDLQAELLGRDLSEIYVLVLDSLNVTTGNSNLVGLSIKDLMTVICPFISGLIQLQVESVDEFLFSVTGRTFKNGMPEKNNDILRGRLSTKWIFVFFFRLYVSCQSLFRQAISLMPPDSSRKMSAAMGDSFVVYSGSDWMEKTDWTNEGYFSGVVQPSNSLINVIKFFSDVYIKDDVAECSPLIYVLVTMAIQRLVDLNRQIKSLEYLLQNNENAVQFNLLGKSDLSQYRKKCKKWRKQISVLNEEAADLTEFIMGYVSLVENMHPVISSSDDASCEVKCVQELHASDEWNIGVCAVDEKSLPTAIWWIVSQNIDIWCTHAASKKLKLFLSVLIHTSCSCVTSNFSCAGKHSISEAGHLKGVTVHQISHELLRDSFLYEHKFVRRHLASRFCHSLEESALSLFSDFSIRDVDFHTSPNWITVLGELENSLLVVSSTKNLSSDSISVAKSVSYSLDKLHTTVCKEKKAVEISRMKFTVCQSLLDLLCWMPKTYLNSKSFSLYMTCLLNLERIVVGCLLKCQNALFSCGCYNFFRLLVSCRRTLKYIIMASCEEKTEGSQSSPISILSEGSNFVLWLFKSVFLVTGLQEALSDDCSSEIRDMIFSLIDHTSYIFLTLGKHHLNSTIASFVLFDKPSKGKPSSEVSYEQNNFKESGPCVDSFKEFEAWKSMFLVMEGLEEQAQSLLVSLKDALCDRKVGFCDKVVNLNKLSSLVSCFSGILWGLASAANHSDEKNADEVKLLRWKCKPISKLNHYIDVFADVTCSFFNILVVEEDQTFQKLDYCKDPPGSGEFLPDRCNAITENLGTLRTCAESIGIDEDSRMSVHNNRSKLQDVNSPATFFAKNDLLEVQCFNRQLLGSLLKGNHPKVAFSLRQLLIASSAILRLNLQRSSTPFFSGLVPTLVGISEFLLSQLADVIEVPQPFTFVWLDGVLRYLEELGNHFPLTNPTLTRNVYTKLIELHLRAIGKCISLQGKKATLASHETESSTKILDCSMDLSEAFLSHGPYFLDEFKDRLRMSFIVFIKKPSDLHLLSAVQAIERSLVGVQEGCSVTYNISTGSGDGAKVSSIVAAGIYCLDLVLEYVSGRKRIGVIRRHIQNFIAALFNVVVHLQSPLIFYGKPIRNDGNNEPDPGSVILMCIEVLTRISGKHALFQMDSWHVAQSIRIPAALFEDIHQPRLLRAPVPSTSAMSSNNQKSKNVASMNSWAVDRQFSINLFAACCKLLYTILKHHKSECEQCIALLEESVRVLLHCLETVDTDLEVRKGYFSWEEQEGIKCACFLRRIYEELRQQKDVFGRHCFKFLSNYISVYSGCGPVKTGIRREIDEALKPGVYALIDACSADDLQYLHTVFGEGPCRNTLASLQQDYKLNFQYQGKV